MQICANASQCAFESLREAQLQRLGSPELLIRTHFMFGKAPKKTQAPQKSDPNPGHRCGFGWAGWLIRRIELLDSHHWLLLTNYKKLSISRYIHGYPWISFKPVAKCKNRNSRISLAITKSLSRWVDSSSRIHQYLSIFPEKKHFLFVSL